MSNRVFVAALLAVCLISCSDVSSSQDGDSVFSTSSDLKGFLKVAASGKSTYVGTDDSDAKENEKPRMMVKFDYDFALGRHEVTCGEFNKVMGEADLPKGLISKMDCEDDDVPVSDVTYYDAVLYANARSQVEKKDSAYSYTSVTLDAEGHCIGLTGLAFNAENEAYRLPTEAEWVFAASENWDVSKSWTSDNSDYKSHVVCELEDDPQRFCDMEGNVKEFVNDWLGNFTDTTITNFVGAPNGDALGQRVLKGGSYKHGKGGINTYRRGDDYVVTSVSHGDYVGFRLAFGSIPDPVWMSGGVVEVAKSISLLNSLEMKSLMGGFRTKLAYRNDITGHLEYIDYSVNSAKIVEIADTMSVYHPDISPSGEWVAFCTGMEGVSGPSSIYIRRLDASDSTVLKLNVDQAAIPRWRVTEEGDTVIVYVTDAGRNDGSVFLSRSTWQVPFAMGRLGTPVKLFDGAYHGGVSEDGKFAVTGAKLLRVHKTFGNVQDTIWYDGEQACNVSLSKDDSKRTLFLDFGGKTGREYAGVKYGVHERLLVMDSTGKLVKTIPAPEKFSFDHSEWTKGDYAVATLSNSNGVHGKIVLVDMRSGEVTELVKGDELWHPALWTDADATLANSRLDKDSAGIYMFENDSWGSVLMRYKMELLWRYRDSANVAVLGSSRPLNGISPEYMTSKFFTVNFAHTPNSIYASRDYLKNYLFKHLSKLKYVVLSLDIDFWWKIDGLRGDNFFVVTAPSYPGYVYDANHNYWEKEDGAPEALLVATEKSIGAEFSYLYTEDRGRYLGAPCIAWGEHPEVEVDSTLTDDGQLLSNSMNALKEIIEESDKRGIVVVGIIFPMNPRYKETGAFGRYGLRRSKAEKLIEDIKALTTTYKNFVFMDENKMGNHDYTDKMAVDTDHLCLTGAPKITSRLDSLLRTLEK